MTYVANNDIILAAAIAGITAGVNSGKDAAQISAMSLEESAVYSQTAQGIYAQALVTIGQQPSS